MVCAVCYASAHQRDKSYHAKNSRHSTCTPSGLLGGDYPPLSTDRIEVTAAVQFGGFPILAPILTHKGVLRVNFTWTEPLMDQATADVWIDDVWELFTQLV